MRLLKEVARMLPQNDFEQVLVHVCTRIRGGAPSGQLQTGRDELRNVGAPGRDVALLEQMLGTGLGVSGQLTGREIPGAAPEVQRS